VPFTLLTAAAMKASRNIFALTDAFLAELRSEGRETETEEPTPDQCAPLVQQPAPTTTASATHDKTLHGICHMQRSRRGHSSHS
jgi:hypothetical protein